MLKPEELRLNNLVLEAGEVSRIYQIEYKYKTAYRINDVDIDERTIADRFEPIPLTPEILEKCGFEKYKDSYSNNHPRVILHIDKDFNCVFSDLLSVKLQHLHQLQNLFFFLCGEELQYTP